MGPMTDGGDQTPHEDDDRVAERAQLLPEELAVGSADPTAQAEQILAESDRRTEDPVQTQQEYRQTDESTSEDRATERSV